MQIDPDLQEIHAGIAGQTKIDDEEGRERAAKEAAVSCSAGCCVGSGVSSLLDLGPGRTEPPPNLGFVSPVPRRLSSLFPYFTIPFVMY